MSNKSGDLFTFLTGAAVGAAAVFFSNKKNRDMTQKAVEDLGDQISSLKGQYQKNPEKFKEDAIKTGKQTAAQVTSEAAKMAEKAAKALEAESKKTTKKVKPKRSAKK